MVNVVSLVAIIGLMMIYQGGNLAKTKWSTKIVLSSLMVVASNVVIKWAVATLGVTPAGYMVWEYLGLVIGGVAYVGVRRQGMRVGASGVAWGADLEKLSDCKIVDLSGIEPLTSSMP